MRFACCAYMLRAVLKPGGLPPRAGTRRKRDADNDLRGAGGGRRSVDRRLDLLDLDLMDVAAPVVAPAAGACIIYFYGTLIAWAVGLALLGIGALFVYRAVARRRRRDESDPSK